MRVVLATVVDGGGHAWGASICERTALETGIVYPALDKLMGAGVITDRWEDPAPEALRVVGCTNREIARLFGVTHQAVSKRLMHPDAAMWTALFSLLSFEVLCQCPTAWPTTSTANTPKCLPELAEPERSTTMEEHRESSANAAGAFRATERPKLNVA